MSDDPIDYPLTDAEVSPAPRTNSSRRHCAGGHHAEHTSIAARLGGPDLDGHSQGELKHG